MNTKLNPLVSVIVPIYNADPYLEQCINSLINQSYKKLEIILVNDGSTDSSSIICNNFKRKDSRVIVIHKSNEGLSSARNTGLEASTSGFVMFLDSDDWIEPNTVEIALFEMINGGYDLIMWQRIKEYDKKSIKVEGPFKKDIIYSGIYLNNLYRRSFGPVATQLSRPQLIDSFHSAWGKVYRAEIIKNNGLKFIDTKIIGSEDILFFIQYLYYCKSAKYIHKHLIHYRKTNTKSITKSHGSTLYPRYLRLFEYLFAEIKEKELDDIYTVALNNRIAISMMNIGLSEVSPRNQVSTKNKIMNIKQYLNNPLFIKAYSNFEFKYLPLHWAFFFKLCKQKFAFGVFVLLKLMRVFIKK